MVAPLIALIVVLGVYPKPVLDRITPSVNRLVAQVNAATHSRQPAVATRGTAGAEGTPTRSATAGQVSHKRHHSVRLDRIPATPPPGPAEASGSPGGTP